MCNTTTGAEHRAPSLLSRRSQGILLAILSAASFGLIPLFSIPLLRVGMDTLSVLFYRFAIASLVLLGVLIVQRTPLFITLSQAWRLAIFGVLYNFSSIFLYYGYQYMSGGTATTLIFMYPVWTAVIMAIFFGQKLVWRTAVAIASAIAGVFLLADDPSMNPDTPFYVVPIVVMSGLSYSIYMVLVDRLQLREMGTMKLTFYVFAFGLLFLTTYIFVCGGRIAAVPAGISHWSNLLLLGIVPTVLSNVWLIQAIARVGSTMSAILGAFEPVMAVAIGVLFLSEPFTLRSACGILLIIAAVLLLVLGGSKAVHSTPMGNTSAGAVREEHPSAEAR